MSETKRGTGRPSSSCPAFKAPGTRITLGFTHRNYGHLAVMPEAVRAALADDLD
ncbi:MAG: hypothetical protein AB7P52_17150 [Alphaproteobacteria bacterium]